MSGAAEVDPKWVGGSEPVGREEEMKVVGRVLSIATDTIYKSNVYTFGGEYKIQKEGSPIGLDLSGEVGRLEMGDFDRLMEEKLEENGIKVDCNGRYVDDINTIIQAIPFGWRWVEGIEGQSGRMEYDDKWVEEDEREPLDRHTMTILVKIANSIKTDLNFTGDCCSNNEDGYIPVLDMKMKTVLVTETAEGRPPTVKTML